MALPNYLDGQIVLVNKPLTWTSFDVVNKMRYALKKFHPGIKRFKVGHTGTLDPLATGLLVICTGKKTKTIPDLTGLDKEYTGTIQLGATTPSYDLETEINQRFPTDHLTEALILEAKSQLTGEIFQTPPAFSAKKVNGVRAYHKARKGQEVSIPKHLVNVREFDITAINGSQVSFRIVCSKGTYIRSIAYDLGQLLDCGGHLIALKRTAIGDFKLENAVEVITFVDDIHAEIARQKLSSERT